MTVTTDVAATRRDGGRDSSCRRGSATSAPRATKEPMLLVVLRPAARFRLCEGSVVSASASERRARKRRVSTAACEPHLVGDLLVGETLATRERREAWRCCSGMARSAACKPKSSSVSRFVGWNALLDHHEIARGLDESAPVRVALLRQADVVRDFEQPGRFEFGSRAALDSPEGVQERDLVASSASSRLPSWCLQNERILRWWRS